MTPAHVKAGVSRGLVDPGTIFEEPSKPGYRSAYLWMVPLARSCWNASRSGHHPRSRFLPFQTITSDRMKNQCPFALGSIDLAIAAAVDSCSLSSVRWQRGLPDCIGADVGLSPLHIGGLLLQ